MSAETRSGVTVRVLLAAAPEPAGALVLFTLTNNFLIRSADLFVDARFLVAMVDAPSDHASGISRQFRTAAIGR